LPNDRIGLLKGFPGTGGGKKDGRGIGVAWLGRENHSSLLSGRLPLPERRRSYRKLSRFKVQLSRELPCVR